MGLRSFIRLNVEYHRENRRQILFRHARSTYEVGPVAQRLEQGTHNPLVPGSNPGGPSCFKRSVSLRPCNYGLCRRISAFQREIWVLHFPYEIAVILIRHAERNGNPARTMCGNVLTWQKMKWTALFYFQSHRGLIPPVKGSWSRHGDCGLCRDASPHRGVKAKEEHDSGKDHKQCGA